MRAMGKELQGNADIDKGADGLANKKQDRHRTQRNCQFHISPVHSGKGTGRLTPGHVFSQRSHFTDYD